MKSQIILLFCLDNIKMGLRDKGMIWPLQHVNFFHNLVDYRNAIVWGVKKKKTLNTHYLFGWSFRWTVRANWWCHMTSPHCLTPFSLLFCHLASGFHANKSFYLLTWHLNVSTSSDLNKTPMMLCGGSHAFGFVLPFLLKGFPVYLSLQSTLLGIYVPFMLDLVSHDTWNNT